ncbi:hypothetical protein DFS34DRAFT_668065 [Phlyctochytrium arcticum]|nr:hypothetical protein DFS34DRAFT_655028 [Phlyctochytrium arcticum]KAI9103850.1 hypothetical protein DFS34DRAFT_668065 [Phlyctochytrium arcticum]
MAGVVSTVVTAVSPVSLSLSASQSVSRVSLNFQVDLKFSTQDQRQVSDGLSWYDQVPGKRGNKYGYNPGCIGCGTKSSTRFHKFIWAELDSLRAARLRPQVGPGAADPYACNACRTRWYKAGIIRQPAVRPIIPAQPNEVAAIQEASISTDNVVDAAVNAQVSDDNVVDAVANGSVILMTDFELPEPEGDDVDISETSGPSPATLADFHQEMRNFIAHPFGGNPFVEMDEFVAQYPRLYELKSLRVGHDESRYSVLYNDRMKRHLIFAICYEGQCMDRKTDYVKRYIGSVFISGSHTDQRLLSRVNLGYHPSKSITRMNNMIMTAHERVVKDILENDPLLVITIDDFHWCQVRPVPDAANAPGKFTSARTTANYAVKLHRELPPLPPAITDVLASVLQDTTWIPSVLCAPAT